VPPLILLLNVVVKPTHTLLAPVMVVGNGTTVTVVNAMQPVANVYVIVAAPPARPVTTAPAPTLTALAELLHVPPDIALLKVVVVPAQIFLMPVMAADTGFTVAVIVEAQPLEMNV
jgi:hypothetical protein